MMKKRTELLNQTLEATPKSILLHLDEEKAERNRGTAYNGLKGLKRRYPTVLKKQERHTNKPYKKRNMELLLTLLIVI